VWKKENMLLHGEEKIFWCEFRTRLNALSSIITNSEYVHGRNVADKFTLDIHEQAVRWRPITCGFVRKFALSGRETARKTAAVEPSFGSPANNIINTPIHCLICRDSIAQR